MGERISLDIPRHLSPFSLCFCLFFFFLLVTDLYFVMATKISQRKGLYFSFMVPHWVLKKSTESFVMQRGFSLFRLDFQHSKSLVWLPNLNSWITRALQCYSWRNRGTLENFHKCWKNKAYLAILSVNVNNNMGEKIYTAFYFRKYILIRERVNSLAYFLESYSF